MRRIGVVAVVLLLITAFGAGVGGVGGVGVAAATDNGSCEFPVSVTDATGTEVVIEEEPDEVVALGPSTAQTLWEIGADEKVTGMPVNQYTEDLDGAEERENVFEADDFTVDLETVIDLDPDLVIAPSVIGEEDVESLRDAGLTVYLVGPESSIDDVRESVALKGELVGECEGATETVEWMDEQIAEIEANAPEGDDRPTVYVPVGGGFTAGEGSLTAELIETAGGDNLGSVVGIQFYDEISQEEIIAHDPDVIVHTDSVELSNEPEYGALTETTAMQHDQIVLVDGNEFSQPAPGIVRGLETLSDGFQNVETGDPADTSADDPTETPADGTDSDDEPADDSVGDDGDAVADTDEDAPGFGIAIAGLVLVGSSLLLAIRSRQSVGADRT